MNVSDAIQAKRAVRHFEEKAISREDVHRILNAGRRSQSSKNTQPWQFVAIQNKNTLKALSECGTWAGHLAGAALGVAIVTPNPGETYQRMFDAGQAAAYMQLAACELGIGSCLASIYEVEKAGKILGLPKEWLVEICLSFGYPAKEESLTTTLKKGGRKTLDEVVHWDQW